MTVEKYEKAEVCRRKERMWSNDSGDMECNECEEGAGEDRSGVVEELRS